MLHKREGLGARARNEHPLYGRGADYVVVDGGGLALAAIERKTHEDLARSLSIEAGGRSPKIFRQLLDLTSGPCPILLIEGMPSVLYRRMEPAAIGLQFWCARQGIAIDAAASPHAEGA